MASITMSIFLLLRGIQKVELLMEFLGNPDKVRFF